MFIFGRVFVIQNWSLELEEQRDKISTVPVWVKLWHLPKELIGVEDDDKGISFAASLIGTPYSMDLNTKRRRKIDCCRVCILVSADQEFPNEMTVDVGHNVVFGIEYEWLPPSCKRCRVFGHKMEAYKPGPRDKNFEDVPSQAQEHSS